MITHPARTSIKVLIELFQKFAGRGQRPRRDPQIAKLPSVQELGGLGDLRKKSPFLNNIRKADTSLRTCKRTFILTCIITFIPTFKCDMHKRTSKCGLQSSGILPRVTRKVRNHARMREWSKQGVIKKRNPLRGYYLEWRKLPLLERGAFSKPLSSRN